MKLVEYFKQTFQIFFNMKKTSFKGFEEQYSLRYMLTVYFFLMLIPYLFGSMILGLFALLFSPNFDGFNILMIGGFYLGFLLLFLLGIILFHLLVVGVQHLTLRKFFHGKASFSETVKVFLAIATPFALLNVVISIPFTLLSFIPLLNLLFSFPIALVQIGLVIFAIVTQGMLYSIKHDISQEKGIISAFMPAFLFIILSIIAIFIGVLIVVLASV